MMAVAVISAMCRTGNKTEPWTSSTPFGKHQHNQSALFLQHVGSRRVFDWRVLLAAKRWRLSFLARPRGEPGRPIGPPAALVLRGALQPLLRAARIGVFELSGPVVPLTTRRV